MKARYLWLSLFTFIVSGVIFAPASLVTQGLKDVPQLRLTAGQGTIWDGQIAVSYYGRDLGIFDWSLSPRLLFTGVVRFNWELSDLHHDMKGALDVSFDSTTLIASGHIDAARINRELSPYHIAIGGRISLNSFKIILDGKQGNHQIDGEIRWNGGRSTYRLAGELNAITLPPLQGNLATTSKGPTLIVTNGDEATPLIIINIEDGNWANIGITKKFTEMVSQPWPGNVSPETVVLRVEEKIF